MSPRNDNIRATEARLQKHCAAKEQLCSLDAIRANICSRMAALDNLKVEIGDIAKQLHYYDMVDYLGNAQKSSINLKSAGVYLREISEAIGLFEQDADTAYAKKAGEIRTRLVRHGLSTAERYFMQERYKDAGLGFFLGQISREETERVYFQCRRRSIANKVSECTRDIRKNYKLFITGEASAYDRVFGTNQASILNEGRGHGLPQSTDDLTSFGRFLYEIFADIFRNTSYEVIKSLLSDESEHAQWPTRTLHDMASLFYKAPASVQSAAQEYYAL